MTGKAEREATLDTQVEIHATAAARAEQGLSLPQCERKSKLKINTVGELSLAIRNALTLGVFRMARGLVSDGKRQPFG